MKKISAILGVCLLASGSAFAQKSLVKEVDRDFKNNPENYPETVRKLTPAFTNEESANDPFTYVVPGKAAFEYFAKKGIKAQMGQNVNKKQLGEAPLQGFEYLCKALPLDSLPDEKGKIKPKYSKDIIKTIGENYTNFQNAALFLWEAEDYANAVKAWELYVTLPQNPTFANAIKAPADTIVREIYYNMGIGNSLCQNNEAALENFKTAIALGYTEKNAYDYAISAASQLQNYAEMAAISEQAYALYGSEDNRYIGFMINDLIDKKEFAKASALIDKYIAEDPNNAQLYFVKGVVSDAEGKPEESMAAYKQALTIDDTNANANMQYGYKLYQKACDMDQNETSDMKASEYNEFRSTKVDPMLREAATYLEKAYQLDDNMTDARSVLRSIYYNLNDEENLKRVENM
ncbi:MAG: hypothetical protein HDS68_09180 [Bacteroidales bacterium]|nr:hypothetical protein [Bacteroidales bacterium]